MAFKIGTYTAVPARNANTHGVELRSGGYDPQQETETDNYWMYPGNPAMNPGSGWKYRSIFTHGYTTLGYKGSNAWRATNKTWHPTDTTLYCGEQMDREGSYLSGTFSDHNGYTENNGHTTAGTNISLVWGSSGNSSKRLSRLSPARLKISAKRAATYMPSSKPNQRSLIKMCPEYSPPSNAPVSAILAFIGAWPVFHIIGRPPN